MASEGADERKGDTDTDAYDDLVPGVVEDGAELPPLVVEDPPPEYVVDEDEGTVHLVRASKRPSRNTGRKAASKAEEEAAKRAYMAREAARAQRKAALEAALEAAAAGDGAESGAYVPPKSDEVQRRKMVARIAAGGGCTVSVADFSDGSKEAVAAKVEELRAAARTAGGMQKWLDPDFHGPACLGRDGRSNIDDEWRHMEEIADPPVFATNGFEPSDVKQGGLGDCWFISAVAVAATKPEFLTDCIVTTEYNEEGVYGFRFFKNGRWVPIIIDGRVPVKKGVSYGNVSHKRLGKPPNPASGRMYSPVYCRPANFVELWVMLLEKAFAKLHGTYEAIVGGWVNEALMDLSGGNSKQYGLRSDEERRAECEDGSMFRRLCRFTEQGHLMGCGSNSGKDTDVNSQGIVQGHAYSLLRAAEVDGHQLLLLRNPWGSHDWKGKWSDVDTKSWTPDIKAALDYDPSTADPNNGLFWMCFADFVQQFRNVYFCRMFKHVRDGGEWHMYRTRGKFPRGKESVFYNDAPQFYLQPTEARCVLVLQLSVDDIRGASHQRNAFRLMIIDNDGQRVTGSRRGTSVMETSCYTHYRESVCEGRISPLASGKPYIVVCSSYYKIKAKYPERGFTLIAHVRGGKLKKCSRDGSSDKKFLLPLQ